jgi:NAD(P)-dependent dehydrogenase (short-subunit alcohol dehydrogenase family)
MNDQGQFTRPDADQGVSSMVDHSLKGKTVLIAGGAKNLGGLIARDLAEHGAKAVAVHYNSGASKAEADATVAAVQAAGAKAVALQANLTSAGAMEKLFARTAIAALGRPDIAINTVGKVLKKPIVEIGRGRVRRDERGERQVRLLLPQGGRPARRTTTARSARSLRRCSAPTRPSMPAYAGTKAPVEHFTRAAAKEFGERGISVTAIGPGPMDTPFFYPAEGAGGGGLSQDGGRALDPSPRPASPISRTSSPMDPVPGQSDGWWMTGQTILVNGGYTTK